MLENYKKKYADYKKKPKTDFFLVIEVLLFNIVIWAFFINSMFGVIALIIYIMNLLIAFVYIFKNQEDRISEVSKRNE